MDDKLQKLRNYKKELLELVDKLEDDGYQINLKYRKARDIGDETKASILYAEMVRMRDEIYKNYETIKEIDEEIEFSVLPVKVGELVDLRTIDDSSNYTIYLHDQPIKIGEISYRGYHVSDFLGDVGCNIDKEYRFHGYGTEALALLNEILYDKGISDFWVTAHAHNVSSRRIIEKNGGKLFGRERGVCLYEVPTKLRNFDKNVEHRTSKT